MSAHAHHYESVEDPGPLNAPKFKKTCFALVGLGVIGLILAFVLAKSTDLGIERVLTVLLVGMCVPFFIGAAAMFYNAVHSVTSAEWMIPLRRLMEGLSHGVWLALPMFVIIACGGGYLYDWYDSSLHLFHVPGGTKEMLVDKWRFIIMNLVFFGLFIFFQIKLVYKNSVDQDAGKDTVASHKKWSVLFLLFFAPCFTIMVWDLILSLHVNWFSTMWGVYCFASAVQTFLCVLILLSLWLRRGPMKQHIGKHILHDLGTWMVGWSCFCAYIGFSQYMLIYYSNLDEETFWYVMRTQNGYGVQYSIEAFIRWPLIFLGLMSQSVRARPAALVFFCSMALVGNWLDWNWLILPAFNVNNYACPFSPDVLFVGAGCFGGLMLLALAFWKKHGLIPKGDPRLLRSINAEHLH